MKAYLVLILLCLSSQLLAYDFSLGEEIIAQETFWKRLPDGDGASCQVQYLAKLTVREIQDEKIIVQYNSDRNESPANCPNDVMLNFEPHHLDTHRDLYLDYRAKKNALKKIKSGNSVQAMGNYSVGDKLSIDGWFWAVVEEPINHLREGDLCRLIAPSMASVKGFYPEKNLTLLSYQSDLEDKFKAPNECPENTIFFTELEN